MPKTRIRSTRRSAEGGAEYHVIATDANDESTKRGDFTFVLTVGAAIFAGLIGTNVLDSSNAARPVAILDALAIMLWVPALLLLAVSAYHSPGAHSYLRKTAWLATTAAVVTTGLVLVLPSFNFTRAAGHGNLLLSRSGLRHLQALCGQSVANRVYGRIRLSTLKDEFVLFTFAKPPAKCRTSVDIPRGDIIEIQENPKSHP